ncbi:MAG TPA: acyl-CoA carboxylase subunit epsilon [Micromonosporaceae bacterium]
MDDEPLFRVVRGAPTAEELAALVGVLWARRQAALAAAAAAGAQSAAPRSRWRASAAPGPGRMPVPGRGAWSHTH